jgi:Flp pilus assembly pilin Flp
MSTMIARPYRRSDETGQTMAEYSVVMGLILVVVVAAFSTLSGGIHTALQSTINIL